MIDHPTRSKAIHVLRTRGKAPVALRGMNDDEITSLAALVGEDGLLKTGAIESYRAIMIGHNERLKATDEEFDEPAPVVLSDEPITTSDSE